MTDDIVTRLRATTTVKGWYDDSPDVVFKNNPLCYEAADEIERLRNIIIGIALNKQVWKGFNFG